jgi:hypothetical protein
LDNIYENYEEAYNGVNYKDLSWVLFFFSLAAAYLLLMGKFSTGLNILLSAVIAGGLSIVFGLLTALLLMNSGHEEESVKLLGTTYTGFIVVIGIISIISKVITKWLVDKLALITYVTIPVFLCFLWSNFYPKGHYESITIKCKGNSYIEPAFTIEPWHFAVVCILKCFNNSEVKK